MGIVIHENKYEGLFFLGLASPSSFFLLVTLLIPSFLGFQSRGNFDRHRSHILSSPTTRSIPRFPEHDLRSSTTTGKYSGGM